MGQVRAKRGAEPARRTEAWGYSSETAARVWRDVSHWSAGRRCWRGGVGNCLLVRVRYEKAKITSAPSPRPSPPMMGPSGEREHCGVGCGRSIATEHNECSAKKQSPLLRECSAKNQSPLLRQFYVGGEGWVRGRFLLLNSRWKSEDHKRPSPQPSPPMMEPSGERERVCCGRGFDGYGVQ